MTMPTAMLAARPTTHGPFALASALLGLALMCVVTVEPVSAQPASTSPSVALSELSNRLGWKQPMYYSTVQTADIDGDGQDEVLARWIDGLAVYRFEQGVLQRHSRLTDLRDAAGFYLPSSYATIRAGVLDAASGRADVIARKSDGIHVYRYDSAQRAWRELGADAAARPFADHDATGTDWTLAKHYSTLQLVDLTADGAAELVGRGRNGLQVWKWQPATEQWLPLVTSGELTDAQGFDAERYYASIHFADLDGDGAAELVVRASEGVRSYRWAGSTWTRIGPKGPFADDSGFVSPARYRSVRTHVDATGGVWLYGMSMGDRGAGSGVIEIHRWQHDRWQPATRIALPELGWDRASQSATLRAVDLDGDLMPEFVVRGARGLHAYSSTGEALQVDAPVFADAQGWNLAEHYQTMHTLKAKRGDGSSRTLLVGRGSKGLETYAFDGTWRAASESNFPAYCATPSDGSAPCVAYKAISNRLVPGNDDIRSQYTQNAYTYDTFIAYRNTVTAMTNPIGPANQAAFEIVQKEMAQELGYAATVKAWFGNFKSMLDQQFNDASGLLGQAITDVSLSTSTSVLGRWIEYGGDITSSIAYVFDDDDQPGTAIGLVVEILDDIYGDLAPSSGDVNEQIATLQTQLNDQITQYPLTITQAETDYLTDYAKLNRVGTNAASGGLDWAHATLQQIADAAQAARNGMLVNFYRTLLPAKWQVYWCDANELGGIASCGGYDYTPSKFFCQYGTHTPVFDGYSSNAYIWAGDFTDVNWTLLGRLTGPTGAGNNNLNAVWYMAMLGGDLGWDLPQWGLQGNSSYLQSSDPQLAWDQIKYGYKYKQTGCDGDGSTTGKLTQQTSLGQWLAVAQHNGRHVSAAEARTLLPDLVNLKEEAEALSIGHPMMIDLGSPLREAALLVDRATLPTSSGGPGSTSATTATHLVELFVRRVAGHAHRIGPARAEYLATRGYCMLAQLQGQGAAGESCQGAGWPAR